MSEESAIGSDKLSKIFDRFPDVDLEWLITGKGNMLKKALPEIKPADNEYLLRRFEELVRENEGLKRENEDLKKHQKSAPRPYSYIEHEKNVTLVAEPKNDFKGRSK